MNMQICSGWDCADNMWPTIEPTHTIPDGLVTFMVADSWRHPEEFCHFYIDDYRFDRLWARPESYIEVLRRYKGVIGPDFSTYTDMPYPMQMWNKYRSMALTHYWQSEGIDVIPELQFSDQKSLEWAFDGMPKYSVLACSSVGVARNRESRRRFVEGMEQACRMLEPAGLIMYGSKVDFDANDAEVYWFKNDNHERVVRNVQKSEE